MDDYTGKFKGSFKSPVREALSSTAKSGRVQEAYVTNLDSMAEKIFQKMK